MALFGFAINFNSGATDYVIVSAPVLEEASATLVATLTDCDASHAIESITHYDAEAIIQENYRDCAILSTQFAECDES